jgi:hypothetical protein
MKKAILIGIIVALFVVTLPVVACECGCCDPKSPGYWKNHPEAWPAEGIIVGGVAYDVDEAIVIMQTPCEGDKSLTLFNAVVAAKLNVWMYPGCCSSCICSKIASADALLGTYPPGSNWRANSDCWQDCGECLYEYLDAFNNGELT